ncbi:hypothetical protein TNCV_1662221 [Trichonephila clavipes]|nr:hypothetical protein TNCV_1662221 [Trichonephila clavipes]
MTDSELCEISLTNSELLALCKIPVPFLDPLNCKICYYPRALETMRKQGLFHSNSRYTRHLRQVHGIDTKVVSYFCPTCLFKGTVKTVKAHLCSGKPLQQVLPSPALLSGLQGSMPLKHLPLLRMTGTSLQFPSSLPLPRPLLVGVSTGTQDFV